MRSVILDVLVALGVAWFIERCPSIAIGIIHRAARMLPRRARADHLQDWLNDLEYVSGPLSQVWNALTCFAQVPAIRQGYGVRAINPACVYSAIAGLGIGLQTVVFGLSILDIQNPDKYHSTMTFLVNLALYYQAICLVPFVLATCDLIDLSSKFKWFSLISILTVIPVILNQPNVINNFFETGGYYTNAIIFIFPMVIIISGLIQGALKNVHEEAKRA